MNQRPNLVQRPTQPPPPVASGWEYARLISPQATRKCTPGTIRCSSAKRLKFETNDDFKERCMLA
jgi:hypothetical protein